MRLFTNIFIILLVFAFSVQASKLGEGRKQVGGTASFSIEGDKYYENSDGDGITTFSLMPTATMFVMPGLEVGGAVIFSYMSQGDNSLTTWGIGPMVNYYFGAAEDKDLYPFVGAAFIYQSVSDDNDNDGSQTTIRLDGGIVYFLNNNVAIRAQAFYDMESRTINDDDLADGTRMGIEAGFSIFID